MAGHEVGKYAVANYVDTNLAPHTDIMSALSYLLPISHTSRSQAMIYSHQEWLGLVTGKILTSLEPQPNKLWGILYMKHLKLSLSKHFFQNIIREMLDKLFK